jgi:ATP-dependent Clp protease adaptor protein ClpS
VWHVILHNDDRTTLDFLAEVVVRVFSRRQSDAAALLLKLYREGRAVAGIYPDLETAEAKVHAVRRMSQTCGCTLIATCEKVRRSQAA